METRHRPAIPLRLEEVIGGLAELETVFGDAGRRALGVVRARLSEAMAARDRGDAVATVQAISAAMGELSSLADRADARDGQAMRLVAERFAAALLSGDVPEARRGMDFMFERSGARERKD